MIDKMSLLTVAQHHKLNSVAMNFVLRQALNITLEPYSTLSRRLTEWIIAQEKTADADNKIYWYRLFEIWRRIVSRAMKDDNLRLVGCFKASFYHWFGSRL